MFQYQLEFGLRTVVDIEVWLNETVRWKMRMENGRGYFYDLLGLQLLDT